MTAQKQIIQRDDANQNKNQVSNYKTAISKSKYFVEKPSPMQGTISMTNRLTNFVKRILMMILYRRML